MDDLFDSLSLEASLDDLKTVYRVLQEGMTTHPELERNGFFASLGRLLRAQAHAEGVDPDDGSAWRGWLRVSDGAPTPPRRGDLLN